MRWLRQKPGAATQPSALPVVDGFPEGAVALYGDSGLKLYVRPHHDFAVYWPRRDWLRIIWRGCRLSRF